jgi:hypothetical protein
MLAAAKGKAIDEPSDLDKKLFLLEQTLKANDQVRENSRTTSAVHFLFDYSFAPLAEQVHVYFEKFQRFFGAGNFHLLPSGDEDEKPFSDMLKRCRAKTNNRTEKVSYFREMRDSKIAGIPNLNALLLFTLRSSNFSVRFLVLDSDGGNNVIDLTMDDGLYDTKIRSTWFSEVRTELDEKMIGLLERKSNPTNF